MTTELSKAKGIEIKTLVGEAITSPEAQKFFDADSQRTTTRGSL